MRQANTFFGWEVKPGSPLSCAPLSISHAMPTNLGARILYPPRRSGASLLPVPPMPNTQGPHSATFNPQTCCPIFRGQPIHRGIASVLSTPSVWFSPPDGRLSQCSGNVTCTRFELDSAALSTLSHAAAKRLVWHPTVPCTKVPPGQAPTELPLHSSFLRRRLNIEFFILASNACKACS